MANGRRVSPAVKFNGKNVSVSLATFLRRISYEDPAEGESDTVSIELHNIGQKWLNAWAPVHGDQVEAGILLRGFETSVSAMNFGTFTLDSVKYKGGPLSLTIGAISQPTLSGFAKTKQTFTWKNVSLREIAQKMADKYSLSLVYEAKDATVESMEQNDQTDSEFLKQLCKKNGFSMKIFNSKIVIYEAAAYEAKDAVATFHRSDFLGDSWSYDSELEGVYEAAEISYSNAKKEQTIKARVGKAAAGSGSETGARIMDTTRCLYINEKCETEAEARQKALAALNEANRGITTLSVTILPNLQIFSTSTVMVEGMGVIDGKYFVKKMSLEASPGSGTTQRLDMYRIYDPVTA